MGGAPGTMAMAPGTMTMSTAGAPGMVAMPTADASQFSMQGAQSIVGSQMLGTPAIATGMPGQATMAFPGQMMAGGAPMATGQAVSTFDALDRNHDGVLSRDELAQGLAQGQVATAGVGASVGGGSVISAAPVITMDGQQPA